MKPGLPTTIAFYAIALAVVSTSHGQMRNFDTSSLHSCSDMDGIVHQLPNAPSGAYVELYSFSDAGMPQSATIEDGRFHFRCVQVGAYELRVRDSRGNVLHSDHVQVNSWLSSVQITLHAAQTEQPSSPWVSVRQLRRKTNSKADGELRKASAAADRGKFDEVIVHARKALERDPAHPQAFLMLGVACSRLDRNEEAAEHFAKAAELDPDSVLAQSNLAMVMLKLERYAAAEEPARRALKIASPLPQMHLALGVSLAGQRRNPDEAILNFDRAANSYPRARLAAVRLLIEAGRRGDAATRLEEYLRTSGDTTNRTQLETLLANLK